MLETHAGFVVALRRTILMLCVVSLWSPGIIGVTQKLDIEMMKSTLNNIHLLYLILMRS
jgi:hypothetical protein